MTEIMKSTSRINLISAIEMNIFGLIGAYRNWSKAEVHDENEIKWSMTNISFPLFNSIMGANLEPMRIDDAVHPILEQARTRNVPVLWWIGPRTQPSDLGNHLERHGFIGQKPLTGMAVDMDYLRDDLTLPMSLEVERVTNLQTRRQWSTVCAAGFNMPGFVAKAFEQVIHHADAEKVQAFVGRQNNQPVATSLLILSAGVAGIYLVTTLPEARGQGIGASLTVAALREARLRDYKISVLQATKMSVNIYRSLGYVEYCKIIPYLWQPGTQIEEI